MIDLTPTYTDDVVALILSERELVYAEDIAPIVRMHPDVIRKNRLITSCSRRSTRR